MRSGQRDSSCSQSRSSGCAQRCTACSRSTTHFRGGLVGFRAWPCPCGAFSPDSHTYPHHDHVDTHTTPHTHDTHTRHTHTTHTHTHTHVPRSIPDACLLMLCCVYFGRCAFPRMILRYTTYQSPIIQAVATVWCVSRASHRPFPRAVATTALPTSRAPGVNFPRPSLSPFAPLSTAGAAPCFDHNALCGCWTVVPRRCLAFLISSCHRLASPALLAMRSGPCRPMCAP